MQIGDTPDIDVTPILLRPVFLDALIPTIDPQYTHFNMRATGVSLLPNGKQTVTFEDGSAVEADLVIGSDGIKSTVRPYVAGEHEHKHLASANTATYRALISIEALKKEGVKTDLTRPLLWVGSDRVSHFPFRGVNSFMSLTFWIFRSISIASHIQFELMNW